METERDPRMETERDPRMETERDPRMETERDPRMETQRDPRMETERTLPAGEGLPRGWLPKDEFVAIYRRVPRLCVEVVIVGSRGVLLSLRDIPPNIGAWHIPGGTVLFGEPLVEAVRRVARRELGLEVVARELLGYIEYPSHYENGIDSPVGLAFSTDLIGGASHDVDPPDGCEWFSQLPSGLYEEQREFLANQLGFPTH